MEKVNAAYETLFIVDLSLGDDGVRAMTGRFLAMIAEAGEITETSEWGKRRLAYPINDLNVVTMFSLTTPHRRNSRRSLSVSSTLPKASCAR